MTSAIEVGGSRSASRLLVGRDDELARLEALVDEIVAGHRLGTVLVEGPAGIGKTRVVDELGTRLHSRGIDLVVGHCVAQGEQMLPYAPVMELLAELVRREGAAAVLQAAGPAGPELGRLVPALGVGEQPVLDSARSPRLFQAVSALLQNLSFRRPLVVVIEDVHWADTSTRELLALLTRQQQGDVVLLLTLRTDESPAPAGLTRYLAELVRRGDHRVALQPLSREQQAHQISDILGVPPRRQLLDEVYERAEGNPFFAEEVLALVQQGDEGLPATVRDLLVARLEALSPATQQVLRTASVIGRTAPYRLLEAVVDVSGERLEEVLRDAVSAHVLRAEGDGLTFRHALLQEAVAASLLPGEAARTHRRIAEALTRDPELAGQGALVAGRLARHWAEAGDQRQALSASVAAALEACDALAFAESLSHYERALELVEVVPDAEALLDLPRARLLYWAAEVAHLAAHPDRATELVREAIARVDPDDLHLHGWLHERLGRYLWMSADTRHALASYQRAVELVPAEPPTRGRAAVLSGLSQMLMLTDRFEESERWRARRSRWPPWSRTDARSRAMPGATSAWTSPTPAGSRRASPSCARPAGSRRSSSTTSTTSPAPWSTCSPCTTTTVAWRRPPTVALESVSVTETLGLQRRKGVWCRCDAAQVLILLGRLDEAGRFVDDARQLQPQGIDAFRTDVVDGQLSWRRGDVELARAMLVRAEAAGTRIIDPHLLGPLYVGLVETARRAGRRRGRGDGGRRTGCAGWTRCRTPPTSRRCWPRPRRPPRAPYRRGRRMPGRCWTGPGRSWRPHPAPGTPAELEVRAAEAELTDDATAWARRGHGLGGTGRSVPVRRTPTCGLAEALLAHRGDRDEAAEHLRVALRHGAADRCRRAWSRGPRTSDGAPA